MSRHINLRATHTLLWRLYSCIAIASFAIGLDTLIFPNAYIINTACDVVPYWIAGSLWLICGVMIIGSLIIWSYKIARLGLGISIVLYCLMGTGMLTDLLFNTSPPAPISTIIAYYILAISSFFILLEPPVNPETAIRNKNKE